MKLHSQIHTKNTSHLTTTKSNYHHALPHDQCNSSLSSSGKNDDPSQSLATTTSSVSPFSSNANWERSHSSSNLNNSNGNKKKMCVDLKEEKHGMRLMLPSWPTTTNSNAPASRVPIVVPHYLPKKNLVKEGRENLIQQVNTCTKALQESSAPPQAEMDLKHYHHYNIGDTVNSTRYFPSTQTYQTDLEARQTVRKKNDLIHDITTKYPTDFDVRWKKDAVRVQQEGDFLIRHEEHNDVEGIRRNETKENAPFSYIFSSSTSPTNLGVEQNERSKSKYNHDNETNKSKNGLPTTTEELEEEGKRAEVYSRSEAFLSDTSCSLSSSTSSSQCLYQSDNIPYFNVIRQIPYIEKQHVTNTSNNNSYRKYNPNYCVKPIHDVVCSGHIKDNNDDDESVKHDNLSCVKFGENIIPSRHQLIVNTESIKPCNFRLPPTYHIRDNKFSIENVVEKSNQDNVSHEKGGRNESDDIWCNGADVKSNRSNPHNYHPDQNSILSIDKRCDTSKPSYHDFVTLTSAYKKDNKESDESFVSSKTNLSLNDDGDACTFAPNEHRLIPSCLYVNRKKSQVDGNNSYNLSKTNFKSKSTPNISKPSTNSGCSKEVRFLEVLRHPNNRPFKRDIPRPVSLIEERVEDFHIIHEAGSCEILSSCVPHNSVSLPFDRNLTRPNSPSQSFEVCSKTEEESKARYSIKEDNFDPRYCYTSTKRRICYRSSIRIMVRPENLLHLQQQDHNHNNPVIPRSNSLEGISSNSSSSNSSVSETARSAKKMSAASLARHKISTQESPEGANTFSDTSSENTQPSIVKEQFR